MTTTATNTLRACRDCGAELSIRHPRSVMCKDCAGRTHVEAMARLSRDRAARNSARREELARLLTELLQCPVTTSAHRPLMIALSDAERLVQRLAAELPAKRTGGPLPGGLNIAKAGCVL